MTILFTYRADVGFVSDLPARDITNEDSDEVKAGALANSKTPFPCYVAVMQETTRAAKGKTAAVEDVKSAAVE